MYSLVKYGKKHTRRNFRQAKHIYELPNLIENQLDSFKQFTEEGLKELFDDISPVVHSYGTMQEKTIELYFKNYHFDEPKYSILECKQRETSYTKALRCEVLLRISETGEVKEHKNVFMSDFPWMTPTGTFIVNGAERVVVNQIIRSSGVLFKEEVDNKIGRSTIIGQVIPTRGAWIEFETGSKDILYAKVDRSKKIYLPEFLKSIGIETHKEMIELFGDSELLKKTIEKDPSETY